jgi:mycothiol synthase
VNLPSDLSAEPIDLADLDELTEFVRAVSLDESGRPHYTRDELHTSFTAPGFDPGRDGLTVRDSGGAIVGVEWVRSSVPFVRFDASGLVATHRLGEGIGSALLDWAKGVAVSRLGEAPEGARVTLAAGVDSRHRPGMELMEGSGMDLVREFLEMRIDFDGPTPEPVIPDGLEIRGFVPGEDDEATYLAIDEAFRDHFGHVERPFEAGFARFRHWMSSPSSDPTLCWLAVSGDDIAGNCLCEGSVEGDESIGYVGNIGVRRPWRGKGLAKALLLTAFGEFRRRGKTSATLHVDAANLTGATRLYEAVGMHESERYAAFEAELRPGEELRVR